MPAVEIEEIGSLDRLAELAPAWTELWQRAPAATPFQSPAWLVPWWRHVGTGALMTLAAWRGGALVGILPLYLHDEPPARKLLPLGIGNSDWLDATLAPESTDEVAAALLDGIAERAARFDVCDLQPLPATSTLLRADVPGLRSECVVLEPCPVLRLPGSPDGLGAVLPKRMRQNLRYYRRRADRLGTPVFEQAGAADLDQHLAAFFALHGARWQRRGLPGVLADEAVRAFHLEAAPALLGLGVLRLHALRLNGRIAASLYGFAAKGRFLYYLAGFDPALADLGPGTLVIAHAMERAAGEGVEEFDFLRGREPYKYHWGASDRPSRGRRLARAPALTSRHGEPCRSASTSSARA